MELSEEEEMIIKTIRSNKGEYVLLSKCDNSLMYFQGIYRENSDIIDDMINFLKREKEN